MNQERCLNFQWQCFFDEVVYTPADMDKMHLAIIGKFYPLFLSFKMHAGDVNDLLKQSNYPVMYRQITPLFQTFR